MKKIISILGMFLILILLNGCSNPFSSKQGIMNVNQSTSSELEILNQATSAVENAEKIKAEIDLKISNDEQAKLNSENNVLMDLSGIQSGDLSSIKGTWKNANGEVIEVSSSTIDMFQGGLIYHSNSEERHNSTNGGYNGFTTGEAKNGSYSIASDSSSFASYLILIPKGVSFAEMQPSSMSIDKNSSNPGNITYTYSKGDISDMTKDRMIFTPLSQPEVGPIATEITSDNVNSVYYKESATDVPSIPMSNLDKAELDSAVKAAQILIDKLPSGVDKTNLQQRINKISGPTQNITMDINKLAAMDFSSVQGTWENKDGDKIQITGQQIQISRNEEGFILKDIFTIGGEGQNNGFSFKYGDSNSSGIYNNQYYIFAGKYGPDSNLYFTPKGVDDTQSVIESSNDDMSNSKQINGDSSRDRISWPNHVGPLTGVYDHDFYRIDN